MKWLSKLMRFDYEIQFKKGLENVSADALSRIQSEAQLFSLFSNAPIATELLQRIAANCEEDPTLQSKILKLQQGVIVKNQYVWNNQQLRRKGKLASSITRRMLPNTLWILNLLCDKLKKLICHFIKVISLKLPLEHNSIAICLLRRLATPYLLRGLATPYLLRRLAAPYLLRGLATSYLLRRLSAPYLLRGPAPPEETGCSLPPEETSYSLPHEEILLLSYCLWT
nr:putative mitochondrial protein [Tanacetum cinerariifolium]